MLFKSLASVVFLSLLQSCASVPNNQEKDISNVTLAKVEESTDIYKCGGTVREEIQNLSSPLQTRKSTYAILRPLEESRKGGADWIVAINNLPGHTQRLALPNRNFKDVVESVSRDLLCSISSESRALHSSISNSNARLRDMSMWLTAGRYDLAYRLKAVADEFESRMNITVDREVGLGTDVLEEVKSRLANLSTSGLDLGAVELSYSRGTGRLSYVPGKINVGISALQQIIVANFLWIRQGSFGLENCFLQDGKRNEMMQICDNVHRRVAEELVPDQRGRLNGTPKQEAGSFYSLGETLANWQKQYGQRTVAIFLDEIWQFLSAVALVSSENSLEDCFLVTGADKKVSRSMDDCKNSLPNSDYSYNYVNGLQPIQILSPLRLALSHELAHHALKHNLGKVAQLKEKFLSRQSFDVAMTDALAECKARAVLETEADVIAAITLEQSGQLEKVADYSGQSILRTPREVAPASRPMGRRFYTGWMAFFDGFAAIDEGGTSQCGYLLSKSRQVLFHTFFLLSLEMSAQR